MDKLLARFLFGLIWVISLPPLGMLYILIRPTAWTLRKIFKYRLSVIRENLRKSFPVKSGEDLLLLEKSYYSWMVRLLIEAVKATHFSCTQLGKRIEVINPELLRQYAADNQDLILLAAHTGNWEWLPSAVCQYGFDLLGVYKPQSSKIFNHLTYLIRKKKSVFPIPMKATMRAIHSEKEENSKPRALLLIADQIPALGDIHYWSPFLNQTTAWFTGGAKIALKYNLPVLYAKMLLKKPGYYTVEYIPLRYLNDELAETEIVDFYTHALEETIREQPVDWLWSHRRWKHQPEDVSL